MAQVETVRFKGTTSFDGQSGGRRLAFHLESSGHRAGEFFYYWTKADPFSGGPRESISRTVSVIGDTTNSLTCGLSDGSPWIGGGSSVTPSPVIDLYRPRIPSPHLFVDPALSEDEGFYTVSGFVSPGYASPAGEASDDGSGAVSASLMIDRGNFQVGRLQIEIQLDSSYTIGAISQTFDLWDFNDPSIVIEIPESCQDAWDHFAGFN